MTIDEMEQEISAIPRFGAGGGLDNLKKYLDILGHPEDKLRVIHVAGTNGKGSVCAYLEAILRAAGYRTALFTSPHLVRINERFRINARMCTDEELIDAWEQIKKLLPVSPVAAETETPLSDSGKKADPETTPRKNVPDSDPDREPLTYFEILFLMSLLIFPRKDVDYCIMETGLGGRLDATVLTHPVISVITSISLDHTAVLGDTIEEIAAEKAGIIKHGVPVVVLDEDNGAFPVIRKKAERNNSHIYRVRSEKITFLKKAENTIDFSFNSSYYKDSFWTISGTADYQIYNAALALTAVRTLLPSIRREILQTGLLSMRWDGRMEQIFPRVYVDGAHNPGAAAQICRMIVRDGGRWSLLFAVCEDKDYRCMIRMLADIPWQNIYVTGIKESRGADVPDVADCFRRYTDSVLFEYTNAEEAFRTAFYAMHKDERLLCLGSLYLVGEIKKHKAYILEREDIS